MLGCSGTAARVLSARANTSKQQRLSRTRQHSSRFPAAHLCWSHAANPLMRVENQQSTQSSTFGRTAIGSNSKSRTRSRSKGLLRKQALDEPNTLAEAVQADPGIILQKIETWAEGFQRMLPNLVVALVVLWPPSGRSSRSSSSFPPSTRAT